MKALKAITSIYHLNMKFQTTKGTRKVKGSQYDSKEYYNKSFRLAEKDKRLPQIMEIGTPSMGLMETNIDPCLQEDEPAVGPIEELVEV